MFAATAGGLSRWLWYHWATPQPGVSAMLDWVIWYSNERRTSYHLYFDCPFREGIYSENLRVEVLSHIKDVGLQLCDNCNGMLAGDRGQRIIGNVVGEHVRGR